MQDRLYANNNTNIEGYYIEFGGFGDDDMEVAPVLLVSTFKWKDYDFRNIEKNVNEGINDLELDSEVTDEELEKIINEIIDKVGIDNTEGKVINKELNGNILSFDIVISINGINYTMNVEKEVELISPFSNPKTIDNINVYAILFLLNIIFFVGIIVWGKEENKD